MNERIDQFTESMRQRISKMERQLETVKSDIHADMTNDKRDLQSKLKIAGLLVHKIRKDIKVADSGNPKVLKAHEKNGTAIAQGWKTEIKKAKLDSHASRAEDNAESAITIAEAKVAEAILATYEAIDARISSIESGNNEKH